MQSHKTAVRRKGRSHGKSVPAWIAVGVPAGHYCGSGRDVSDKNLQGARVAFKGAAESNPKREPSAEIEGFWQRLSACSPPLPTLIRMVAPVCRSCRN